MADPAAAATAPDDDMGGDTGADAPADAGSQGMVIATILALPDGGYQLIAGDEDEGSEAGEGDEGGAASGEQGTPYDSVGALLKGVLDLCKQHEETAGGKGSAEDNFAAGFSGAPVGKASAPSGTAAMGG